VSQFEVSSFNEGPSELCSAIRTEVYLSAGFGNGNVPVFLVQEKETSAPLVGYSHKAKPTSLWVGELF
jgi:hypothetical protein